MSKIDLQSIISDRKLLIVDRDPIHRGYLLKTASEMGFQTRKMILAKDGIDALNIVREEGVHTILYDDAAGMGALESILNYLSANYLEQAFVFLLSQNSSQASAARAAELDVDGFCVKPVSTDALKAEFKSALLEKLHPSEYRRLLNLGKARLQSGDLEQAEKLFEKAKTLDDSPATAHFYMGQVALVKKLANLSQTEFKKGLELNQVHYKCLNGLVTLLKEQKKPEECYAVFSQLVKAFPAHADRLKQIIRMSVDTAHFTDLSEWVGMYDGQDDKPEDLKRHVASGLAVLGRFHLAMNQKEEALAAFEKSIEISVKKAAFQTYAVEALQKHGHTEEATRFVMDHDPAFTRP